MDTSKVTAPATRIARGIALHRERGDRITRTTAHTYRVPACSGSGSYLVHTDLGCCSCPDYQSRRELGDKSPCKHLYAVYVYAAKLRALRRRLAS